MVPGIFYTAQDVRGVVYLIELMVRNDTCLLHLVFDINQIHLVYISFHTGFRRVSVPLKDLT